MKCSGRTPEARGLCAWGRPQERATTTRDWEQLQLSGAREGCDWEPKGLFGSREGDNSFTNNQSSQITITKRGRGERIQNGRYLLDGNNAPFLIIGDARPLYHDAKSTSDSHATPQPH